MVFLEATAGAAGPQAVGVGSGDGRGYGEGVADI